MLKKSILIYYSPSIVLISLNLLIKKITCPKLFYTTFDI